MLFHMYSQLCECEASDNFWVKNVREKVSLVIDKISWQAVISRFFHGFRGEGTPLCFRSKIFLQKRSLERQKKHSKKNYLNSWIIIINI